METNIIVRIRTKTSDYEIDIDEVLSDVEKGTTWTFDVSDIETIEFNKKDV